MLSIAGVLAVLAGCNQDDQKTQQAAQMVSSTALNTENAALKAKIVTLEVQIGELRNTPVILFAAVTAAGTDLTAVSAAAAKLKEKFPDSPESGAADKRVAELAAKQERAEAEAKRIAELGFKALKVTQRFDGDEASIALTAPAITRKWIFDAYDSQYHYREAEKGASFVVARVMAASKAKDPKLPGMALYVADGDRLTKLASFEYRFVRWDDYASFLGNNSDYRNDFAHSASIALTIGASIDHEKIKKPLFLVASRRGCYASSYDRFHQPPMSYNEQTCDALKATLNIEDFQGGAVGVVHRLD